MGRGSWARRLYLSFAVLIFLTCSVSADTERQYNVQRAPIAKALVEFAKQSDISIIRPHLSYRDGKANVVRGSFTLEQGLSRLLKGTGFSFKILSPGAVRVIRTPKKRPISDKSMTSGGSFPSVIEEIKVSATRRTDFIDKLPYGISAVSGTTLDRLFGGRSNNAIFEMMGLTATNQGESRDKLTIRGLSDGAFSGRTQALVSTYLDYARMNYNAPEPGLKLVDIATVEILRGPQGTLYGSGSLSGIYHIVTNKPAFDRFESKITNMYKMTDGGSGSQEYTVMFNVPVIADRLAIRAIGYYEKNGGYIDDVRLRLDNVNDSKLYGGRFSTGFTPREWLHLTAGFTFQHLNAEDANYYNGALGPTKRNNYTREPHSDILKHPYLTVEADLSWADLVSNISWLDRDIDNYYDGTYAVPKLSNRPLTPSRFEDDRHIKTISSETHLNSQSGDHFEWLAGFFLSHRSDNIVTKLITSSAAQTGGFEPEDILFTENLSENLDEIAVFGEVTYAMTERFALTGGLRWFHYANSAVSLLKDVGIGNYRNAMGEQQKSNVIPKFTISFYASDSQLYYLQIAEGYRLGGINLKGPTVVYSEKSEQDQEDNIKTLTTFDSDRLLSFELGFKNRLYQGRLHLNGAVFFTDWRNIQSDQFDAVGLPIIGNIGNGRVVGAEVEMAFRPVPAMQLKANAAWNSSDLTKITNIFGKTIGAVKDGSLPVAPKFTMNLSGQYEFSLGAETRGMIDLSYTYVGSTHLLFAANSSRKSNAYHLGSLRFEVSKGAWRATLFADNIFNTNANTFAFGNPFSLNEVDQVTPLRPRSYGLQLGWSY